MRLAARLAETSTTGALVRASIAWLLITPAVAAAKIWWSGTAALVTGVLGVAIYVGLAARIRRHYREPPNVQS
ncbi:MAG TPA: hypothetical protein VH115_01820 [Solirubrobacteraceae bacterium]|nr:hypothetical protein [Solirubrobacteraceae bacterium]